VYMPTRFRSRVPVQIFDQKNSVHPQGQTGEKLERERSRHASIRAWLCKCEGQARGRNRDATANHQPIYIEIWPYMPAQEVEKEGAPRHRARELNECAARA